jgi:hypothetical protein
MAVVAIGALQGFPSRLCAASCILRIEALDSEVASSFCHRSFDQAIRGMQQIVPVANDIAAIRRALLHLFSYFAWEMSCNPPM